MIRRVLDALELHEVREAADGDEAWSLFERHGFDLILTDWNMPGLSGLELVRNIRARNAEIPVFMITTEAERRRVMEAIDAGVTEYIVKPFTPEVLTEKLRKHGF